jgi:hypothetical protein
VAQQKRRRPFTAPILRRQPAAALCRPPGYPRWKDETPRQIQSAPGALLMSPGEGFASKHGANLASGRRHRGFKDQGEIALAISP